MFEHRQNNGDSLQSYIRLWARRRPTKNAYIGCWKLPAGDVLVTTVRGRRWLHAFHWRATEHILYLGIFPSKISQWERVMKRLNQRCFTPQKTQSPVLCLFFPFGWAKLFLYIGPVGCRLVGERPIHQNKIKTRCHAIAGTTARCAQYMSALKIM